MLHHNSTIEIQLSKTKLLLLLLGCLGFVAVSIWMFTIAGETTRWSPTAVKVVAVTGITFFGLGVLYLPVKLLDKRPGLIINDQGIQDDSNFTGGHFIPWGNIIGFETLQVQKTKILLVKLKNAETIINKQSNWKQKVMRYSQRMYGTPVSISSGTLNISFSDLEKLLSERHNAFIEQNQTT